MRAALKKLTVAFGVNCKHLNTKVCRKSQAYTCDAHTQNLCVKPDLMCQKYNPHGNNVSTVLIRKLTMTSTGQRSSTYSTASGWITHQQITAECQNTAALTFSRLLGLTFLDTTGQAWYLQFTLILPILECWTKLAGPDVILLRSENIYNRIYIQYNSV